jgi:hypothetical protein
MDKVVRMDINDDTKMVARVDGLNLEINILVPQGEDEAEQVLCVIIHLDTLAVTVY